MRKTAIESAILGRSKIIGYGLNDEPKKSKRDSRTFETKID